MEAAYKPVVNGDLDTQNFEKFDEVSINRRDWLSSKLIGIFNYISPLIIAFPLKSSKTTLLPL